MSLKESSSVLSLLLEAQDDLEKKLGEISGQIRLERLRIAKEEYGVEIGSVVISKSKRYRVVGISTRHFLISTRPWVTGNVQTKSGEFGTGERHLYDDWEIAST